MAPRRPLLSLAMGALVWSLAPAPALAQLTWLFRAPKDFDEVHRVIAEKFPAVPFLTTSALAGMLQRPDPPLLLDFRSKPEYDISHLSGAIWIADLKAARTEIARARSLASHRPVVVYCSVGYRSADLVSQLQKLPDKGYSQDVFNLKGSLFQWANEGRYLVRTNAAGGEQVATQVHPYSSSWAPLLLPQLRSPIP